MEEREEGPRSAPARRRTFRDLPPLFLYCVLCIPRRCPVPNLSDLKTALTIVDPWARVALKPRRGWVTPPVGVTF